MEHPTGDNSDTRKWSIWKSGMVRRLRRSRDFRRIQFLQGPLGQPFSKPKTLLSARLPHFASHLYSLYQPGWRPIKRLGGIEDGQWRTAESKVYRSNFAMSLPSSFCGTTLELRLWIEKPTYPSSSNRLVHLRLVGTITAANTMSCAMTSSTRPKFSPKFIFLDGNMPEMHGLSAIEAFAWSSMQAFDSSDTDLAQEDLLPWFSFLRVLE